MLSSHTRHYWHCQCKGDTRHVQWETAVTRVGMAGRTMMSLTVCSLHTWRSRRRSIARTRARHSRSNSGPGSMPCAAIQPILLVPRCPA